jgi:hypothetical protein
LLHHPVQIRKGVAFVHGNEDGALRSTGVYSRLLTLTVYQLDDGSAELRHSLGRRARKSVVIIFGWTRGTGEDEPNVGACAIGLTSETELSDQTGIERELIMYLSQTLGIVPSC